MKTYTACPDFSLLSQFLDQELEEEEAKKISRHLAACLECRTLIGQMRRAEGGIRTELTRSPNQIPSRPLSQECLSPELVAGYVQRVLSVEEGASVEKHLHACDACLNEIMTAFRISSALTSAKPEPVPTVLKIRVSSLWESPRAKEKAVSFSRLVIQIAQRGLKLLEQHLVPPLLDVQEVLVPMPAYRSGESPVVLNLKIKTGQAEINATAVREGEGVALRMTLVGAKQAVLAGQRVFLRQHGRSVFSAKTDEEGTLRMPALEPGSYEVECPGIQTVFQLELRA